MKIKIPLILSLVILLSMWAVSGWLWFGTPADAQFAVHFDANFQPDRYAGKFQGLLLMPLLASVLLGVFLLLPRIDPRAENLAKSPGLYIAGWIGTMLILAGAHFATLRYSLSGDTVSIVQLPLILGVFMLAIAYFLGKSRSNFFAGIRTPWTLSSDYSWERTHRLGALLFAGTAILVIATNLLGSSTVALYVLLAGSAVSTVVSVIASWFFWKHDPSRK